MGQTVNKVTAETLKNSIAICNKACNDDKESEEAQQKRRAILAVRRILHGEVDINEDQLLDLADAMTEAYTLISDKLEEMGFEEYAEQQRTLGEDVGVVVLAIETVEGGDNVD